MMITTPSSIQPHQEEHPPCGTQPSCAGPPSLAQENPMQDGGSVAAMVPPGPAASLAASACSHQPSDAPQDSLWDFDSGWDSNSNC
jgi:hypothetical protein